MSFAKTLDQFNLIVLEDNEIYLLDRSDALVRILQLSSSNKLLKWVQQNIDGMEATTTTRIQYQRQEEDESVRENQELLGLVKGCLSCALEKPAEFCVRLCSKSIILEQTQHTGKEILKVPFSKMKGAWLILPHHSTPETESGPNIARDLLMAPSHPSRVPRLAILTDFLSRIVCSSVGGRNRILKPYTIDRGSQWLLDICLDSHHRLRKNPDPSDWLNENNIDVLLKHLSARQNDPLFFLVLAAHLIHLFASCCPNSPLVHRSSCPPSSLLGLPSHSSSSPRSPPAPDSQPPATSASRPLVGMTMFDSAVQTIQSVIPSPESFPFARLDHREVQLLCIPAQRQLPLHNCRGIFAITDAALYFRPFPLLEKGPFLRLSWSELKVAIPRIVDLQPTALNLLYAPRLIATDAKTPCAYRQTSSSKTAGGGLSPTTPIASSHQPTGYRVTAKDFSFSAFEVGELNLLFRNQEEQNKVISIIRSLRPNALVTSQLTEFLERMTRLWQLRCLDTFHYLGILNSLSGRSSEDLAQYPIMPWTYTDFTSSDVDLEDPTRHRNLALPIGAINATCLRALQERLVEMTSMMSRAETIETTTGTTPGRTAGTTSVYDSVVAHRSGSTEEEACRFLYGSHYSTSAYVVYWLLRLVPECQLRLQGGRFDTWPRLFHSIKHTWKALEEGRATSFMELIPEFYDHSKPLFLENRLGINVSFSSEEALDSPNSGVLSDVELPSWCQGDAASFLKVLREGLESEFVSLNLHDWIDLIFGYKQSGEEAERALNLFHPVTYLTRELHSQSKSDKGCQLDARACTPHEANASDGLQQQALLTQIREFGQCPTQLFERPHPKRFSREQAYRITETYGRSPDEEIMNPKDIHSILHRPRSTLPWYMQLEVDSDMLKPEFIGALLKETYPDHQQAEKEEEGSSAGVGQREGWVKGNTYSSTHNRQTLLYEREAFGGSNNTNNDSNNNADNPVHSSEMSMMIPTSTTTSTATGFGAVSGKSKEEMISIEPSEEASSPPSPDLFHPTQTNPTTRSVDEVLWRDEVQKIDPLRQQAPFIPLSEVAQNQYQKQQHQQQHQQPQQPKQQHQQSSDNSERRIKRQGISSHSPQHIDVTGEDPHHQLALARFKSSRLTHAVPLKEQPAIDPIPQYVTAISYSVATDSIVLGMTDGTMRWASLGMNRDDHNKANVLRADERILSVTSASITSMAYDSISQRLFVGSMNGELSIVVEPGDDQCLQSTQVSLSAPIPSPSVSRVFPVKNCPHGDCVAAVAVDSESGQALCSASIDQVVAFWKPTPTGLLQVGASESLDVVSASMCQSLALLGGRNGEISLWDVRLPVVENPIWVGQPIVNTYEYPTTSIITDCNISRLMTSGSFSIAALGQSQTPTTSPRALLSPTLRPFSSVGLPPPLLHHPGSPILSYSGWSMMDQRSLFNLDVYASFRNPYISTTYSYFNDRTSRLPSFDVGMDRYDRPDRAGTWECLLFDIRMVGTSNASPPSCSSRSRSSCPRIRSSSSPYVDLNAAVVGRYQWTSFSASSSSASTRNVATSNHPSGTGSKFRTASCSSVSRSLPQQQSITSVLTDGQRWAVAIGIMSTIGTGGPTASSFEDASRADGGGGSYLSTAFSQDAGLTSLPSATVSYTFCSIADLAQGLRACETCRWPLRLGTESVATDGTGGTSKVPTLIAPSTQWALTGNGKRYRLCIANTLGQVEVIS